MRQAGIVAAAAIFALDHHRARLADDHANARLLADELRARLDHPRVAVNPPETNVVTVDLPPPAVDRVIAEAASHGVWVGAIAAGRLRCVLHLDVARDAVVAAAPILAHAIGSACDAL
jgi:threonine aldolase